MDERAAHRAAVQCHLLNAESRPPDGCTGDLIDFSGYNGLQIRGVRKKLKNVRLSVADFALLAKN
jgi:hypothetical protein